MSDAFVVPMSAPSAFGASGVRPAGTTTTMVATPDKVVTSSSAYQPTEGPNAPLRVNNNGEVCLVDLIVLLLSIDRSKLIFFFDFCPVLTIS